jgi:hypothetical protein
MRLASTAIAFLATGSCLIAAAPPGTAEPSRAASHTSGNLIRNAGAEKTTPAPSSDGTAKVALAHWKVPKKDRFTAVAYGTPEFLAKKAAGPSGRGKNFFAAAPTAGVRRPLRPSGCRRTPAGSGRAPASRSPAGSAASSPSVTGPW